MVNEEQIIHAEIELIPKDWNIDLLTNLCSIIGDGIHTTPNYITNSNYYFVNGNNFINGMIVVDEYTKCVDLNEYLRHRKILNENTILISINGTIGNLAFYNGEKIILGKSGAYLNLSSNVCKEFIFYVMQSASTNLYFENELTGTTINNLSLYSLRNTPIPLPPLPEQHAIAEALSDADALIDSLEQLIAKKRAIRQGAMQQLLTGQRRLPGFTGEWDVKKIIEIFAISSSSSKIEYVEDIGIYWIIDMGSISRDGKLIVAKPTNFKGDLLNEGDLIMPKDDIGGGNIIGRAGYIDANETYVLSDHVYRLVPNIGNSLFFSYMINSDLIRHQLVKKVSGSAQLGLGRKSVAEQEIPFPPIQEQTAIAEVLSDMDAEIDALSAKLSKARSLKQGMMQQLLTGRIRLC